MLAGGLADRVMAEVERQFATHGLILKQGTIIDATVVSAAVHKPARVNQPSRLDPDAQWLSHGNGRIKFGYKAHICVDQGSGLIRKSLMTPASTHDSAPADQLIMGDEAAVYADKAYDKKERRRQLRARGPRTGSCTRAIAAAQLPFGRPGATGCWRHCDPPLSGHSASGSAGMITDTFATGPGAQQHPTATAVHRLQSTPGLGSPAVNDARSAPRQPSRRHNRPGTTTRPP
ncbi:MAG: transposase [Acetobacteraceae bacterium]